MEPLKERIEKQSLILWDKYNRESINDGRKQLVERNTFPRLKTRQDWQYKTSRINAQIQNHQEKLNQYV